MLFGQRDALFLLMELGVLVMLRGKLKILLEFINQHSLCA